MIWSLCKFVIQLVSESTRGKSVFSTQAPILSIGTLSGKTGHISAAAYLSQQNRVGCFGRQFGLSSIFRSKTPTCDTQLDRHSDTSITLIDQS